MQITRASEYAMLGLIALSRRAAGEVVMVDTLAQEEGIPASFLGKIFQSLNRAGVVRSARGSGGGFALAHAPEAVSVLGVIEAVEGPIALQRCLEPVPDCGHMGGCALCGLFSEAQDRVKEVFQGTTLADLARRHTSFVEHQARSGTSGPKHPKSSSQSPRVNSRARPRAVRRPSAGILSDQTI
ncbi:MAG: Rrf2 family transcriptional regulator [Verrucomicrobiae bacterium]|nr:Rrf2 family transcriptional regulator [Verrucomicrobiae bacterium]